MDGAEIDPYKHAEAIEEAVRQFREAYERYTTTVGWALT